MSYVVRALYAELLKMKRTLALWLAVIAPLLIVLLQVGVFLQRDYATPAGEDAWIWFAQMVMVFWGLLMVPLFVTLETALVGSLEHQNGQWKHLYALPIPRGALYVAKQCAGLGLIGVSTLCLPVFLAAGGLVVRVLRPEAGFAADIPWQRMLLFTGMTYLGSWLIVSIHTWVDLRWKNFVVSCAAGIALTVAGLMVINADWGSFYPWVVPGIIANDFNENVFNIPELLWGSLGGIGLALLGGLDVTRREVL